MAHGEIQAVGATGGSTAARPTATAQQTGGGQQAASSGGGTATHTADGFHASEDLHDEQEAEEKKKAEEAQRKEDEKKAEEEKKKELQDKIDAKQKDLEQAKKDGDQAKVAQLSRDLEGLQKELEALNHNDAAGPQPAPAAGAGGGGPAPMGGDPAPMGGGAPAFGGGPPGSWAPMPSSLGGYMGPNPSPMPGGPIPDGQLKPNGTGQDAVNLGKQYLGQNAIDIKGHLPSFTAAGGQTNNCADFVSSLLEDTGRIKGHHVNVEELQQSLLNQGYHPVGKDQAQPGDVWISGSRGHTELVADRGANTLIGSNNDRPGHQVISEHHGASGGFYYHLDTPQG